MKKENKLFILNIIQFLTLVILSFGNSFSCCLTFGHGLGDVIYLIPLWLTTLVYFILIVGFSKKIKSGYNSLIIFGSILLLFLLKLIFNHGPECPCVIF